MDRNERAAEAERLYAEGLNCQEVADRLGCAPSTVWRDLKSRNVEMRPDLYTRRQLGQLRAMLKRLEKQGRIKLPDGL
jgi:hypothetical protein